MVHTVHCRPVSEAKNVGCLMRQVLSARSFLSRRTPRTVLDLSDISLEWFRELLRQERALQVLYAVLKPEVGEVNEMKGDDEEAVVYGAPGRSSKVDSNESSLFLSFFFVVCSPVRSDPVASYFRLVAEYRGTEFVDSSKAGSYLSSSAPYPYYLTLYSIWASVPRYPATRSMTYIVNSGSFGTVGGWLASCLAPCLSDSG